MGGPKSIIGVVACVIVLGGCGADRAAPPSDPPPRSVPADRTGRIQFGPTPAYPSVVEPAPPTDAPAGVVSTAAVDDVRIEFDPERGLERVVYSFGGSGIPFWKVGYVAEAVPHRGGRTLPVAGRAIMQVDIMDTALPARHLYDSATPLAGPDGSRVAQLFLLPDTRDSNGITQSFIGIRGGPTPFEAVAVDDPPQLIIEFR